MSSALGWFNAGAKGLQQVGEGLQYQNLAASYDSQADLMSVDADMVLAQSEYATARMEERGKTLIGSQVARYAKAGVTFDGSPMKVYARTERNIRLDILTMKNNAVRQANKIGFEALNRKIAAGHARTRSIQKYGGALMSIVSQGITTYADKD